MRIGDAAGQAGRERWVAERAEHHAYGRSGWLEDLDGGVADAWAQADWDHAQRYGVDLDSNAEDSDSEQALADARFGTYQAAVADLESRGVATLAAQTAAWQEAYGYEPGTGMITPAEEAAGDAVLEELRAREQAEDDRREAEWADQRQAEEDRLDLAHEVAKLQANEQRAAMSDLEAEVRDADEVGADVGEALAQEIDLSLAEQEVREALAGQPAHGGSSDGDLTWSQEAVANSLIHLLDVYLEEDVNDLVDDILGAGAADTNVEEQDHLGGGVATEERPTTSSSQITPDPALEAELSAMTGIPLLAEELARYGLNDEARARAQSDPDLLSDLLEGKIGSIAADDADGDDLSQLVEALEEQTARTGGDIAGDESSDNGPADVGDTGMEA